MNIQILKELQFFEMVISTQRKLSLTDREFLLNFLYDQYYNKIYNPALVVVILSLLNFTGIGKLAFTYNEAITRIVRTRDVAALDAEFRKCQDYHKCFPELYDNSYLTPLQIESMKDLFAKCQDEIAAVLESLERDPERDVCEVLDCCADESQ